MFYLNPLLLVCMKAREDTQLSNQGLNRVGVTRKKIDIEAYYRYETFGDFFDRLEQNKAVNTAVSYRYSLIRFLEWNHDRLLAVPLPNQIDELAFNRDLIILDLEMLVEYMHVLANEYAFASIQVKLAALQRAHKILKVEFPMDENIIGDELAGIIQRIGKAQVQAQPFSPDQFREVVGKLNPDTMPESRDKVILLLGYLGAFRRSELSAVSVHDLKFILTLDGQEHIGYIRVGTAVKLDRGEEFLADELVDRWLDQAANNPLIKGEGIIRIRKSKTNKVGKYQVKVVYSDEDRVYCPILHTLRWLQQLQSFYRQAGPVVGGRWQASGRQVGMAVSVPPIGPLVADPAVGVPGTGKAVPLLVRFRRGKVPGELVLTSERLSYKTIYNVTQLYFGETYSAHSLRVSFVTNSRMLGASDAQIMQQTHHKTASMIERYTNFQDPRPFGASQVLKKRT